MSLSPLPFQHEPSLQRARRRILTIGGTVIAAALLLAVGPPLALAATVVGLLRPQTRFGHLRTLMAGAWAVWAELYGLSLLTVAWLRGRRDPERLALLTSEVQARWTAAHVFALRVLFGLRLDVSGLETLRPRPTILLVRHTSMLDTILPPALLVPRLGTRLRYVLKRELLADPCLDVAGNRIANLFLDRSARGARADEELAHMETLAATMEGNQGVVLFPEGTRASAAKRASAIARLEERIQTDAGAAPLLDAARRLLHLQPLKLGGVSALIRGKPDADVVLVAHTGLEELAGFAALTSGLLVHATVRARFWRPHTPMPDPADEDALQAWLLARWAEVDDAVEQLVSSP